MFQLDLVRVELSNLDAVKSSVRLDEHDFLVDFLPDSVLAELQVQCLPQLGFLLQLPRTPETEPIAIGHIDGLEFKFKTAEFVFYKTEATIRCMRSMMRSMEILKPQS